jgi:hypothetical protein
VELEDGQNISGAQTSTLALSRISHADEGDYSVTICNGYGCVTGLVAVLYVANLSIEVSDDSFGFISNHFGFHVNAGPGEAIVVEVSTNLVDWITVTTSTVWAPPFYFADPGPTNFQSRFYRVRLQ